MRIAVALLIVGCQGEPVAEAVNSGTDAGTEAGTDAGAEASADTADTGACDEVPGNLLFNPSFESGTTGWGASLEAVTGGADHCARYAKFTTTKGFQSSSIDVSLTGQDKDVFEFGASILRLDDDPAGIQLFLQGSEAIPQALVTKVGVKGTWVRFEGTLLLDRAVSSLTIGFGANSPNLRVFGIDRVWLRKK